MCGGEGGKEVVRLSVALGCFALIKPPPPPPKKRKRNYFIKRKKAKGLVKWISAFLILSYLAFTN